MRRRLDVGDRVDLVPIQVLDCLDARSNSSRSSSVNNIIGPAFVMKGHRLVPTAGDDARESINIDRIMNDIPFITAHPHSHALPALKRSSGKPLSNVVALPLVCACCCGRGRGSRSTWAWAETVPVFAAPHR